MSNSTQPKRDDIVKMIGAAVLIAGFLWGIYTYKHTSQRELAEHMAEAERFAVTRRVEATKPYLEMKLKLYTEATQIAAKIATTDNKDYLKKENIDRFMQLSWGELALVEDREVASAMISFRNCLMKECSMVELEQASLKLAHACRDSLARSWGVEDWASP